MKIITDVYTANEFEFWQGAKATTEDLSEEEVETVISMLDELYPEGMSDMAFNDFFWFERDTIAEWLGYADYEHLLKGIKASETIQ